jgi:GntR family transcriptional regulator, rspAB operon transcriptional repressor
MCLSPAAGRARDSPQKVAWAEVGLLLGDDSHTTGYRRFRQAMQEGRLQPGMIVTQNELCAILGISLTPLRETLVLLEEFGLVEVKRRAGIHIVYPEVAFIRENYQFRSVIELHAIRAFQPRRQWLAEIRARHQGVLESANSDLAAADLNSTFVKLDSDMHVSFVAALENRAISAVYARIMDNINLARQVHDRTAVRTRVVDSVREHLAILDSLEKGDAEGAAANLEVHFRASAYRTVVAA